MDGQEAALTETLLWLRGQAIWCLNELGDSFAQAEAAGGDIEGAARNAYMRHLADASGRLESVASAVGKTAVAIVIGGITGTATMPIPAPWAVVAGATAGAVPTAVTRVRNLVKQPRSKGWVAVHQRIAQAAG
jgi:hypothetical protein